MQRKLTIKELAEHIYNFYIDLLQHEKQRAEECQLRKEDRVDDWFFDRKKILNELPFLYFFIISDCIRTLFDSAWENIIDKLFEILHENYFGDYIKSREVFLQYIETYNSAFERKKQIDDGSSLNDPVFVISKLASIRAFGEKEGVNLRNITMLSTYMVPIMSVTMDNLSEVELVKSG